jgi:hypothetical protein
MKRSILPLGLFKTIKLLLGGFETMDLLQQLVVCYSNHVFATVAVVLPYLFISAESLKNHRNHKKIIKKKIQFCWTPHE